MKNLSTIHGVFSKLDRITKVRPTRILRNFTKKKSKKEKKPKRQLVLLILGNSLPNIFREIDLQQFREKLLEWWMRKALCAMDRTLAVKTCVYKDQDKIVKIYAWFETSTGVRCDKNQIRVFWNAATGKFRESCLEKARRKEIPGGDEITRGENSRFSTTENGIARKSWYGNDEMRFSLPPEREKHRERATLRRPFCVPSAMRGIDLSCQPLGWALESGLCRRPGSPMCENGRKTERHDAARRERRAPRSRVDVDIDVALGNDRASRRVTSGETRLILTSACARVYVCVWVCTY